MKRFTSLLILFYLAPYAVAQEVPMYESTTDNVPKIGVSTEVYLGDRMLIQREGEYRECIIPKYTYEKTVNSLWRIKAKQPLCKKDANSEVYYASYFLVPVCAQKSLPKCNSFIRLLEKTDKYEMHFCEKHPIKKGAMCLRKLQIKGIDKNDIEFSDRYFIYSENTFQQSIEYAGRDGDNLRFTYSEFTDGFARQAFTREFQVDYSKGDVAAYKGAIIKIHDATNVNIVYEVIRNFQQ